MDKVICWFSGGVTSAVACHLAIKNFGKENCRIVFIDTKNEHPDTERFLNDCSNWYGLDIEKITAIGKKYESIEDVWIKNKSLNVAHGAICSSELKRAVREDFQKNNKYSYQIFGFDMRKKEFNRAMGLLKNHPSAKPLFPLLMFGFDKDDCFDYLSENSIKRPIMYDLNFDNNNCFQTMCVQGGIGYWKKVQKEYPEKFDAMANREHLLTEMKGRPVTILKNQSKKNPGLVFLKKNPIYPDVICLDEMNGVYEVESLNECNGFCGLNDFNDLNNVQNQINFEMPSLHNDLFSFENEGGLNG